MTIRHDFRQWLQNVGTLERGALIQYIESVGFKSVRPSSSPVSVLRKGGIIHSRMASIR
jgi:hypothetical protein